MACPECSAYGYRGLVPILAPRTPEELVLPEALRPPVTIIWVPCSHCHGGVASCCDTAGNE
jgi:hypothetical protein